MRKAPLVLLGGVRGHAAERGEAASAAYPGSALRRPSAMRPEDVARSDLFVDFALADAPRR